MLISVADIRSTRLGFQTNSYLCFHFICITATSHSAKRLGMGKTANKQGQVGASLPPLPQKDLCQRVNFAVQASTYLHSLGVGSSSGRNGKRKASTPNGSSDRVQSGPSLRSEVDFGALARSNMNATKKMAAHTQLKLYVALRS